MYVLFHLGQLQNEKSNLNILYKLFFNQANCSLKNLLIFNLEEILSEGNNAWFKGEMAITWVARSVWKERDEKDKGSYGHLYSRATSHAHIQRYKPINKLQSNKFKQLSFSFYRRILPMLSKFVQNHRWKSSK